MSKGKPTVKRTGTLAMLTGMANTGSPTPPAVEPAAAEISEEITASPETEITTNRGSTPAGTPATDSGTAESFAGILGAYRKEKKAALTTVALNNKLHKRYRALSDAYGVEMREAIEAVLDAAWQTHEKEIMKTIDRARKELL